MTQINQFDIEPTGLGEIEINLKELNKVTNFVYDSTTEYYLKTKRNNPEILHVNLNSRTPQCTIATTNMELQVVNGIKANVKVEVKGLSSEESKNIRDIMPLAAFSYSVEVDRSNKTFSPVNLSLMFQVDYFHWNQVMRFKPKYLSSLESIITHELTHSKDLLVYISLIEGWSAYADDDRYNYKRMKYINSPVEITARVMEMTYHIDKNWDALIERSNLKKLTLDPVQNIVLNSTIFWPSSLMEDYALFSKANKKYATKQLVLFINKKKSGGNWGV